MERSLYWFHHSWPWSRNCTFWAYLLFCQESNFKCEEDRDPKLENKKKRPEVDYVVICYDPCPWHAEEEVKIYVSINKLLYSFLGWQSHIFFEVNRCLYFLVGRIGAGEREKKHSGRFTCPRCTTYIHI